MTSPASTFIYSAFHRYAMDFSKPPGQDVTYKGYTFDPHTYPDDPRIDVNDMRCNAAAVRRIHGQRFLFVQKQPRAARYIYRFAANSEVAIPCGEFKNGNYIWIDTNGNGQKDETTSGSTGNPRNWIATVASGPRIAQPSATIHAPV